MKQTSGCSTETCTLSSDNSRPICSTSDVPGEQKEDPSPPGAAVAFFVILAPDTKPQTYLLTYLLSSEQWKYHSTPLWRFGDSGTIYKCYDLLTYLLTETVLSRLRIRLPPCLRLQLIVSVLSLSPACCIGLEMTLNYITGTTLMEDNGIKGVGCDKLHCATGHQSAILSRRTVVVAICLKMTSMSETICSFVR